MNKLDWKTKTAGIMGGVYGLMSIAGNVLVDPDPTWAVGTSEAIPLIIGFLAVFGLGAKVQKLIDALEK